MFSHLAIKPRISPRAFIAPNAVVIGDVVVEDDASIWYGSVLRGDVGAIRVGLGSNIQDLCVLHVTTGGPPCEVGAWCTVGHGAILHSCRLEDHAFVGFGARVLDGARVCRHGVVGAGAVVPSGKVVRVRELWLGNPAKVARTLSDEEVLKYSVVATRYAELKQPYLVATP
jgi:carbonic anhydrase/acetyltransferase-like protein (isoleucine patch superfamily)